MANMTGLNEGRSCQHSLKSTRRTILKGIGASGLGGLAGCIGGGGQQTPARDTPAGTETPTEEPEPVDFSIARVPFESTGSHYMPLQWGWVDPVGRVGELKWKVAFPGQITKLVRAKEIDVAEGSLGALVVDHDRGISYNGLATDNHIDLANGVFAHTDSGITEPQDLEGKKVGIHSESSAAVVYALGLAENVFDVDLSTVEWITKDIPTLWNLLKEGDIDASEIFANFWYFAQQHPDLEEVYNTSKEWEKWTGGRAIMQVVEARTKFLNNNPGIDVDILKSLRKSRRYRNENLEKVLQESIKRSGDDADLEFLVKQSKNLDCTFDLTDRDRKTISKFVELANDQGVIDSTPSIDDLFTDTVQKVGHVEDPIAFD